MACATPQSLTENTEHMLAAAGFLEKPANTPRRQQRLAALQPYRILSQRVTAYQRFQQMAYNDSFGWGDWGPYPYWGGGSVVVVGGGRFAGGGFHGGGGHR